MIIAGATCLLLSASPATAASVPRPRLESIPLPSGVTAAELRSPSPELVDRLLQIQLQAVARDADTDTLPFFVDAAGEPVRPDLEHARAALRSTPGELDFTFDSPEAPWTSDQLAQLEDLIALFYPLAVEVYGPPAFTATINIRQVPGRGASYSPSLNQIVLGSVSDDQLCHEILHAFRDDLIVGLRTFEEGMVRAAEVEIFNRLPSLVHWDEHHSYEYDQYFEVLDRRATGAVGGRSWSAAGLALLRYQLSGYAWAKPLLEGPDFLVRFNRSLLEAALLDGNVTGDEGRLVELAAAAQPLVEGLGLPWWYRSRGVFDTSPALGVILYQRLNQYTVDLFERHASGWEEELGGQQVAWAVRDHTGVVLDHGETTTSELGVSTFSPAIGSYFGRLEVCVRATVDDRTVRDCGLRPSRGVGVFGVVATHDAGTVTVTDLDGLVPPQSTEVVNGAFQLPSLVRAAGRFVADFESPDGTTLSHHFTKDAASYVLVIDRPTSPPRHGSRRHSP